MKTGKSLTDLAAEIERQAATKKDYIAKLDQVTLVSKEIEKDKPAVVQMHVEGVGHFGVNKIAHDQIAEHVKIPKDYYRRMVDQAPALLATNVDHWFRKHPAPRMIRTLDGNARAFLSDKFNRLDNQDFAEAMLPLVLDRKLEIMSCEITDTRLYIKAVDTKLFRDVPVGYKMGDGSHQIFDTCAPAIVLSNSEVGFGRLVVETGVYTRACTNMALWSDGGMKRTHVGARHKLTDSVENIDHLLSDATKRKTNEALWLQVRDVISHAFNPETFKKRAERLTHASGNLITGKVEKVVELVAEKMALNDGERESVLKHLIQGGSLSQYGLHSAITRSAQDVADYDRATELEYMGGRVIELPTNQWRELAEAA